MERMTSGVVNLQDNANVLRLLLKFYRDELPAGLAHLQLPWLSDCTDDLADFAAKMEGILGEIDEILARAKILMESAKTRETSVRSLMICPFRTGP
jgi:hypothetical protein